MDGLFVDCFPLCHWSDRIVFIKLDVLCIPQLCPLIYCISTVLMTCLSACVLFSCCISITLWASKLRLSMAFLAQNQPWHAGIGSNGL